MDVAPHLVLAHCRNLPDPYVQQLVRMIEERDKLLLDIATHKYPTNNTKAEATWSI